MPIRFRVGVGSVCIPGSTLHSHNTHSIHTYLCYGYICRVVHMHTSHMHRPSATGARRLRALTCFATDVGEAFGAAEVVPDSLAGRLLGRKGRGDASMALGMPPFRGRSVSRALGGGLRGRIGTQWPSMDSIVDASAAPHRSNHAGELVHACARAQARACLLLWLVLACCSGLVRGLVHVGQHWCVCVCVVLLLVVVTRSHYVGSLPHTSGVALRTAAIPLRGCVASCMGRQGTALRQLWYG